MIETYDHGRPTNNIYPFLWCFLWEDLAVDGEEGKVNTNMFICK